MATKRRLTKQGADDRDPFDQINDLTEAFMDCRDLGHAWTKDRHWHSQPREEGQPTGARLMRRDLVCMRCESTRPQLWWVFKDHLQLVYAGRTYPPGYLLKGIPKGFNVREQIRLRQIAEANRSPRSG